MVVLHRILFALWLGAGVGLQNEDLEPCLAADFDLSGAIAVEPGDWLQVEAGESSRGDVRAYRDPTTGAFREPTLDELMLTTDRAASQARTMETERERPALVPNGGFRVRLGARYHTELRAVRGPDGSIRFEETSVAEGEEVTP